MKFEFKHPKSGEVRIIELTPQEIQEQLSDYLHYELTCGCEPIGETNVVECNCEDYLCDFELQDQV